MRGGIGCCCVLTEQLGSGNSCGHSDRRLYGPVVRRYNRIGGFVYSKPTLERFGTFRELTKIGMGRDGDGGIMGSGFLDGCWVGCDGRS